MMSKGKGREEGEGGGGNHCIAKVIVASSIQDEAPSMAYPAGRD